LKDVSFVIVAAGRGERAGSGAPKQFRELAGVSLWKWSARAAEVLHSRGSARECVLVGPEGACTSLEEEALSFAVPICVVEGGAERQESVLNGLRAATGEYALIHDAARPFLSPELAESLVAALEPGRGVIPLVPVSDALKKMDEAGIISSHPREGLWAAQTPQAFPREALISILASHPGGARDEGEAWSAAGWPLSWVRGERKNIKITWEEDFALAESMARRVSRTGIGYDVHPLVPGRRFILGGVEFPDFPLGFAGYSDGDVLVHSVCDSLLGAAGMSDIGTLYPAGDPAFKGISSLKLLEDAARRVCSEEWELEWVDSVIIAQKPVLGPSLHLMVSAMEKVLPKTWSGRIHLKVKSGEGVGAVGSCHAVVCHSTATLWRAEALA